MLLQNLEQIRDRIHEPLILALASDTRLKKLKENPIMLLAFFTFNSMVYKYRFCEEIKSKKPVFSCDREMRYHRLLLVRAWWAGLARRGSVTACAWLFTRAELGRQPCPAQAAQSCLEFRRGERGEQRGGDSSDRLHPAPAWSLDTRRHQEKIENGQIVYWMHITHDLIMKKDCYVLKHN